MDKKLWVVGVVAGMLINVGLVAAGDITTDDGIEAARQGYYNEAVTALQPLAKKGDGEAQFALGLMYHSGLGVSRDEAQAVRLYQKAAENGHPLAQEYLSIGYEEGWFGLKKDPSKAKYWHDLAMESDQ